MKFQKTGFRDLIVCEPTLFSDDRGYFFEAYNERAFEEYTGRKTTFVQDNQSQSTYGVLRGLHFQIGDYAQAKLVRTLVGEVLDVVVDLRKEEPTYGKSFSIILSERNKKQLFVPKGMAHGFITLSDSATFFYKCDNIYHKESERSLAFNDPTLNIDWRLPQESIILSQKDLDNLQFMDLEKKLNF